MNNFWRNKTVLVTGAHGFVGQNLMKLLRKKQESNPYAFRILAPPRKELDLTREEEVAEYFTNNNPDIVLHLAGKVWRHRCK